MMSTSDDSYLPLDYIKLTYKGNILTNQIVDQLDSFNSLHDRLLHNI